MAATAEDEEPLSIPPPDHKLCGYLHTVLTTPAASSPPPLNSFLLFSNDPAHPHLVTQTGLPLYPINNNTNNNCEDDSLQPHQTADVNAGSSSSTAKKGKKWSRMGMVNGSISVVHQLHSLVFQKYLRVVCRVVRVMAACEDGHQDLRVVVLVDVYLPIELLSGWQFPRLKATAVAIFRHLRCDWGARRLMLDSAKPDTEADSQIWNPSDCHVLGCRYNCSAPGFSKKKLFELHEIFQSLPSSVAKKGNPNVSRVNPYDTDKPGIWVVTDDILIKILNGLCPVDLVRVSATCRHLRVLAASIMPCMKLKLYPHQRAAVEWMLERERHFDVLRHPLYMDLITEDGFVFYINTVSGEIVTGAAPTIKDFHGGMFCDEPGLGKTITALSLILKTQGILPDPPDGVEVIWCTNNASQKCGYYEVSGDNMTKDGLLSRKRSEGHKSRRGQLSLDNVTPKKILGCSTPETIRDSAEQIAESAPSHPDTAACSVRVSRAVRCSRNRSQVTRNLHHLYDESSRFLDNNVGSNSEKRKLAACGDELNNSETQAGPSHGSSLTRKKPKKEISGHFEYNDWVQCDACSKWRRLVDSNAADISRAWFCSMNTDPLHSCCDIPEESYDYKQSITYLPGFHEKGTPGGEKGNISFFTSVLKEHYGMINSGIRKALTWFARLSPKKLLEMETTGLVQPVIGTSHLHSGDSNVFHEILQACGLIKKVRNKWTTRWYYPKNLVNLAFDLDAFRTALCAPLDSVRLYLSKATLVVVPSNLVEHWKTQIEKHVRPGQLRVYVWAGHERPSPHNLAWDYDIVITTFNRLSAEWRPRKRSILMEVHWLRVMLDEGHTLGSSLNLTNKLQLAVSLTASNRWLLTGTPAPNTPNSQVSHLQPMLKFLHEQAYGVDQRSWEDGILRPFEAEMEEGRSRLLELLQRCMISARKIDLQTIPPCIKKLRFIKFTAEHARSYNQLVETVRRNILLADWNDPSHVESLLNPKQWKFRSATIKNVRLSCCVAGHIRVTDAGHDIQETMDILVGNGLDPLSVEYALIKYNLMYGANCMGCKKWCRLPVVTPCKHLLCLECVAQDSEKCTVPECGNLYEMQTPETLARPENPNPKWPVPKDLIELQPAYKQDDWDPDWQSTSSSKVAYLVDKLKDLQKDNETIINSIDNKGVNNFAKHHVPFWSTDSDRSSHQGVIGSTETELFKTLPEKVIIFSQFLEHIHVIEQQLAIAGIQFVGMYSPMPSCSKMESLATFKQDPNCMALVMDGSAALGLDLSFVTHVYLMEPIWDKSMEEQVISRAHRMGATRPIYVETLAMEDTIEHQMVKFLQGIDECRIASTDLSNHETDGPRRHRTLHDFAENSYLANLHFVKYTL